MMIKDKSLRILLLLMVIVLVIAVAWQMICGVSFLSALKVAFLPVEISTVVIYIGFFLPVRRLRKYWQSKKQRIDMHAKPSYKVYDRFIRNTNALVGALFIIYVSLAAIFAHLIIPDQSPYAGDQMNEIAFREPGFTVNVLLLPSELQTEDKGFMQWMLNGRPSDHKRIPITNWMVKGDSIYVSRYLGDGIPGMTLVYPSAYITGKHAVPKEQEGLIEKKYIKTQHFWLGTDDLGRDYLSRIILGTRVSLSVGIIAVLIALFIGIPLGALAGFYKQYPPKFRITRKRSMHIPVDNSVMWMINIIWSIPTLLLVFPIVFAFGQQYYTIFIAVGITMWVDIARMVRGQVMQVREMEFIQAARTFGFSDARTIWKHVLPNITGPVIVITAANFAYAILTEAGLSFLGIGVQPPAPSWGLMIAKYKDNLITDPYLPLIPGFAITLLVLAFFMVGNGLRDALDMKSKW